MAALHRLNRLTEEQIERLREDDIPGLLAIDHNLDIAFGEKERRWERSRSTGRTTAAADQSDSAAVHCVQLQTILGAIAFHAER